MLLTTPERVLSFELKRQELWEQGHTELVAQMDELRGLPFLDLLDESDELLSHRWGRSGGGDEGEDRTDSLAGCSPAWLLQLCIHHLPLAGCELPTVVPPLRIFPVPRYQLVYAWGSPTGLPSEQIRTAAGHALLYQLARHATSGRIGAILARERVAVVAGREGKPGAYPGVRLLPGAALEAALPELREELAAAVVADPPYAQRWLAQLDDEKQVGSSAQVLCCSRPGAATPATCEHECAGQQCQNMPAKSVHSCPPTQPLSPPPHRRWCCAAAWSAACPPPLSWQARA